jgi:glucosamine-6-phosphate deaminase
VGEGQFATVEDVPSRAISLSIHALLRPDHLLVVVPERRKAAAVKAAL